MKRRCLPRTTPEVNSLEEVVRLVASTAIIGRGGGGGPMLSPANSLDLQVKTEAQPGGFSNPWRRSSFPHVQFSAFIELLSFIEVLLHVKSIERRHHAGLHDAELLHRVEKRRLVSLTKMK